MYDDNILTIEDIKQAFFMLFRNKLLILLVTGAGFFAGLLYSSNQDIEIKYDATATVAVAYGQNYSQFTGASVLVNYADIVTSHRVTEYASKLIANEGLSWEDISGMVSVQDVGSSFILSITAHSDSPRTSILVANAVAESFVSQATHITGSTTISILDYSRTATIIETPRARARANTVILLAPLAAFVAICTILMSIRLLSGKVRSLKQCLADDGELLAIIPKVKSERYKA